MGIGSDKRSQIVTGIELESTTIVWRQRSRAVDPDSLDPDPVLQLNSDPIRIQDFDDQQLKKKLQQNFYLYTGNFFLSKIAINLCPSYRRSLQPSKENILHVKNETCITASGSKSHQLLAA